MSIHIEKKIFKSFDVSKYMIFVLTFGVFLLLTLTSPNFFSSENIYSMILSIAVQFFVVLGFTFLLIMGEIDMSVGAIYGFSGALAGWLTVIKKLPFSVSFLITLAICAVIGFISGLIVVRCRVKSMMVTIGVMSALQGLKSVFIEKLTARVFTGAFREFFRFKLFGVHWVIIFFIVLTVLLEIFLNRSYIFKKMYYIGQNIETSRIYGIDTGRIRVLMFILSAVTASVGGMFGASRVGHAAVTAGSGLEFTMITAAVLGGASLFGGKGSILRSVVALFFLTLISNGMIGYSIDPYLQQIILGIILVLTVTIDIIFNRQSRVS
jgi:ribose transport system permease protein